VSETLLIGTGNPGKQAELALLLEGLPWSVKGLTDFPSVAVPPEDGDTFEANAVDKARYFLECFGVACVADDSGLEVEALGGAPGVYSARYSGEHANDKTNNDKLLAALDGTPESERGARFVCCIAFARPGHEVHVEIGTVKGRVAFAQQGPRGFGYDPLFVPEGHARTFAQMTPAEKLDISHRGRALRKLRAYLESLPCA